MIGEILFFVVCAALGISAIVIITTKGWPEENLPDMPDEVEEVEEVVEVPKVASKAAAKDVTIAKVARPKKRTHAKKQVKNG